MPALSNIRLSERWAISDYDSVCIDSEANASGGAQGIKINGPSLYGSGKCRDIERSSHPAVQRRLQSPMAAQSSW
jgi:hypothetical protein